MLRGLSVVMALVLGCVAARADELVLANGDTLTGDIVEWALDHVVIEHPQLGRVRLSLDQLAIDVGEPPSPGLFGTTFLRGWNRSINLGLNGREGNTDSANITAGFDFDYEDDFKRWLFTGRYFFNRSEDGDADNNARVDLRRDWLFPGHRWFARGSLRYQFDRFEDWKHRTILAVGPGYRILRGEVHSLDGLLGVTFTREFGNRQTNKSEALAGFDYTWRIAENHSFTLSNSLYVEYRPNAGELRNDTTGEWKIVLTQDPSLNLVVGAQNEYETDVDPGDEKNDLKYYLAFGVDF